MQLFTVKSIAKDLVLNYSALQVLVGQLEGVRDHAGRRLQSWLCMALLAFEQHGFSISSPILLQYCAPVVDPNTNQILLGDVEQTSPILAAPFRTVIFDIGYLLQADVGDILDDLQR